MPIKPGTAMQAPLALIAAVAIVAPIAGCGGDDNEGGSGDGGGELTAQELAAMIPAAELPQAVAVDVDAAREAAGLEADADPVELSAGPDLNQFVVAAFVGLRDISVGIPNPMQDAIDHGAISAYAGHPFADEGAVTLVSTTQPFDDIAASLESAGYKRDGDVVSSDGSPDELSYTAAAPADGFIVLGYDADTVRAVANGEVEPTAGAEIEAIASHDAPAITAVAPEDPECVTAITTTDQVDGTGSLFVAVDGEADAGSFGPINASGLLSIGFELGEPSVEEGEITVDIAVDPNESGLINSPAALISSLLVRPEKIYDCG